MTNVIKSCLNIDKLLALKMKKITEFQEYEGTSAETVRDIDERLNYLKNEDEREAAAELEYNTESMMEFVGEREAAAELEYNTESIMEEIDQEMETMDEEIETLR